MYLRCLSFSLFQALYLPSDADYSLLKPMHHLTLKGASLSLSRSNILSMLEDLWTKALEDYLEIPRKEFKFYRVILIVPDIIERPVLKELMNLLLLRMEFAAAFLHQVRLMFVENWRFIRGKGRSSREPGHTSEI